MPVMKSLTINGRTYTVTPVVPTDSVTLLASAWAGEDHKYSQVVELSSVTPHTKVDLQPTSEQLVEFHHKVLGFVAENDGGVVTVYSIGDKPANDHTIQITMTEVDATGKIRGNTVGTTMPQSDWAQTDPTKADYIKNKPADLNGTGGNQETDPTVPEWAKQSKKPTYTAQEVGADPAGTAASVMDSHETNLASHPEMRNALEAMRTGKLDASKLPEAINTALAQAQASGAFDGADGITPHIGSNWHWYIGTKDTTVDARGVNGKDGADGADGKTPVKGVDYFTAADQAEMVQAVVEALPKYAGEVSAV